MRRTVVLSSLIVLVGLFLYFVPSVDADITTGLQGWWRFDDGSGGSATDSSGNSVTGTLSAPAPTWVNGKRKGALSFNGASHYVNYGNVLDKTGAAAFTIGAWFNTTYAGANPQTIVSKEAITAPYTGYQFGFNVYTATLADAGKLGLYLVVSLADLMNRVTTTAWNDGKWHYGVVTYDGSKNRTGILLYVDGVLQPMTSGDSATLSGSLSNGTNFEIAARNGVNQPFSGSLDEVRIYSRALSAADVLELYKYEAVEMFFWF
jgi:hypothetical protein